MGCAVGMRKRLTGQALDAVIAETLELEARESELAERIRANREYIKGAMRKARMRLHETASGDEALLYESEQYEWDVRKLARLLSADELDALCPRTPETGRLRKLLDADAARAARLGRCAKKTTARRLVLRAGRKMGRAVEVRVRKLGSDAA